MAQKPARIEMPHRLLKPNGVKLSNDDDGIFASRVVPPERRARS
jgi:hypothetical protein